MKSSEQAPTSHLMMSIPRHGQYLLLLVSIDVICAQHAWSPDRWHSALALRIISEFQLVTIRPLPHTRFSLNFATKIVADFLKLSLQRMQKCQLNNLTCKILLVVMAKWTTMRFLSRRVRLVDHRLAPNALCLAEISWHLIQISNIHTSIVSEVLWIRRS